MNKYSQITLRGQTITDRLSVSVEPILSSLVGHPQYNKLLRISKVFIEVKSPSLNKVVVLVDQVKLYAAVKDSVATFLNTQRIKLDLMNSTATNP